MNTEKGEGQVREHPAFSVQVCPAWTAELVGIDKRKGLVMKKTIRRT